MTFKIKDEIEIACKLGEYNNFSGIICFGGMLGIVRNADFTLEKTSVGAQVGWRGGMWYGGNMKEWWRDLNDNDEDDF